MKLFSVFGKQLFGAKMEGLKRSLAVAGIVFFALYLAEFKIQIAPVVLYLTCTTFPFGIMWQALSSNQNARNLEGVLLLPFDNGSFVCYYVCAMSLYVLMNKSSIVLAVFFALGKWSIFQMIFALFCAVSGCIAAMFLFACKGCRKGHILPGNAYAFYQPVKVQSVLRGRNTRGNMFLYILRYLCTNRNYLINTAGLCGVAVLLPMVLKQFEGMQVMPIGFAILSLNTPLCILLSVDRDLQQAVKLLPGQGSRFCVKYFCFLAGVNVCINTLFLISFRLQCGGMDGIMIVIAIVFALVSAVLSVAMEWYYPLLNWKLESDLYHHPRKYIIPSVMLLFAGIISVFL